MGGPQPIAPPVMVRWEKGGQPWRGALLGDATSVFASQALGC
jgi:hypothetical protein